ncbi:MAG TPA: nucleoside recognition domain-containing protein, partial [Bacteroidota bacterium]|nr:nucleoside recognition domain-containing protein [Bacteroidota bacterium]
MLNYIWLILIIAGILVAVGNDWHDLSSDRYHNGEEDFVSIQLENLNSAEIRVNVTYPCRITLTGANHLAGTTESMAASSPQSGELTVTGRNSGSLKIFVTEDAPSVWKDRLSAQKNQNFIVGQVGWNDTKGAALEHAAVTFDPIKFLYLKSVTNDGIIGNAKTAVELAIGLIGIMALWLGLMRIAEKAGLVAVLARILKPVTTRVFPDVPADHPAMGAMIMNISANMLGLANAATPLGLKAMEELNSLNRKLGTATDAMCTFLVINTSNVQLIPATVIALRAASGSANPAEILGPVLVATAVALVVGITTVKLLARLPVFRRQLEGAA